jgi:UDP-N-acetylglucosamine:LPS N-acetylglucosamine transferase
MLAARLLGRYRPDLVVSDGAGVAFPFFVVARLLRIKTVYLEVYDRIDSATLTGRLCRPLSSLFLVQWEEQRRLYPGARVIGGLF